MDDLPNPDLIYDLFGGIFKPQFIRIAILLDVFTPLAHPSTAEQIAQACHADSTGIKNLLDYFVAARMDITSRVTLLPADLGASLFDLALVGQITHYLTPAQNRDLFRRIHAALTDSGTLVIDCPMSKETPSESSAFLSIFLWSNSGGMAHSFETYRDWLKEVGFQSVTHLSERWLTGKK